MRTEETTRALTETIYYKDALKVSETDNTRFEKNNVTEVYKGEQKTMDWVDITYTYESATIFVSENYNNIMKITGLPKTVFCDKFGWDMQEDICNYLKEFHKGNVSKEDVENYFYKCCREMLSYRVDMHQTTGKNEADKVKIISDVFEVFAKQNMVAARYENYKEGQNIHTENGGDMENDDWSYYNADYYYQCEEMREKLCDITQKLADMWNLPRIDTRKILEESKLTLDGGFDFNSGWNVQFMHSRSVGISYIEGVGIAPPRGMKLSYFKSCVKAKVVEITSHSEGSSRQAYSIRCTINEGIETTYEECMDFMENMRFYGGYYEEYEVSASIIRRGLFYSTDGLVYPGSLVNVRKMGEWFKVYK